MTSSWRLVDNGSAIDGSAAGAWSRRGVMAGLLGCSACGAVGMPSAGSSDDVSTPLKRASTLPIGCCMATGDLADVPLLALIKRNFSQITPSYEMKMGVILGPDGKCRFDAGDQLAAFAQANKMRLHGHTLVWYNIQPAYFAALTKDAAAFSRAYRDYITTVVGHYRGVVSGWDVVNEPVAPDGNGLRDSLWSRQLGADDYIATAFEHATSADPGAVAFINEYGMEANATKRRTFLALVERLLKRGVKIGGIGTQTHISVDLAAGAAASAIADLASLGLPLHVSELDITVGRGRAASDGALATQARRAGEVVDAYMRLPASQRYAITLWGARDRDSWLRRPPYDPASDRPSPFDDNGQPKPMLAAMISSLKSQQ